MIELKIDSTKLDRGLSQLLKNATHSRPMMAGIARELDNMSKENFANEAWGSEKWKDLKYPCAGKKLYKKGNLHDLITTEHGNDFARIGSNLEYAAIHHLGGQAGRGKKTKIPARPYLPISSSGTLQSGAENRILDIALASLKKGL